MKKQKPEHIICFALPAWEADYLRSTVELMKCVSANNLVLYVDYAYTISDCIKGVLGKKKFEWQRLLGIRPRLRRVLGEGDTGLYVLSLPPVFPAFIFKSEKYFTITNKFNAAITGYFINRAVRKLKMKNMVGFNSFQPFLGRHWNITGLKFMVYYIYDDFTNVPWFNGFVTSEENKFILKTDLVIVSSNELQQRKANLHKPIEVVNNGVHFNAFCNKMSGSKINAQYVKTVGYTGTIDNRIDIDLLEKVIKRMPNTRFLFIGKVFDENIYSRLIKYINVCFEPPVPADRMPLMQSQVDLGIIPYVCNALTAAIYPLKANEYLAMGLPVVMTPFASLGEADEVVYTAADATTFVQCIEYALHEADETIIQKRLAIAKKADWNERAIQLMDYIEKYKAIKYNTNPAIEILAR